MTYHPLTEVTSLLYGTHAHLRGRDIGTSVPRILRRQILKKMWDTQVQIWDVYYTYFLYSGLLVSRPWYLGRWSWCCSDLFVRHATCVPVLPKTLFLCPCLPPSFSVFLSIYMNEVAAYLKKIFRQRPIELRDFWVSFTHFSAYYDYLGCLCYSKTSVKRFVRKAKAGS